MFRRSSNEKAAFTETTDAYNKQLQAALGNRRAEMDDAWDELDVEWKKFEKLIAFIGITEPVSLDGGVVHLNVGGEHLNVSRTVLASIHKKKPKQPWTLSNLFDGVWDSRVPRDKGGRIFLDESPVIMRYLVHTQLKSSKTNHESGVSRDLITSPPLLSDQRPYLQHVSRALGLHNVPLGMQIIGGTTVLKNDDELARLSVHIRNWCPGDPKKLELLYRGSRDGLNAPAFHAKCTNKHHSTVTLVRVDRGSPDDSNKNSVVGGFSSVSWARTGRTQGYYHASGGWTQHYYNETKSPGAFIFMAKNGSAPAQGQQNSQPVVWALPKGPDAHAIVRCGGNLGPDFGIGGYEVEFDSYGDTWFKFGDKSVLSSVFQNLWGKRVSEVEVYSVYNEASVIASDKNVSSATKGSTTNEVPGYIHTIDGCQTENTLLFGASIAGALMEEEMALHDARIELASAEKRIRAAACALEAMYGPDIATGKADPVVELDVRGTRITTLRSTLQACPESALAARFDDSKWPSDGKDFGVIDCSPSTFSKVLDVLRLRKRARWSKLNAQKKEAEMKLLQVGIAANDRVSFEEFVGMYFPGCEAFVIDWVKFEGS